MHYTQELGATYNTDFKHKNPGKCIVFKKIEPLLTLKETLECPKRRIGTHKTTKQSRVSHRAETFSRPSEWERVSSASMPSAGSYSPAPLSPSAIRCPAAWLQKSGAMIAA